MEEKLGRPLQWVICLIHLNELPFRSLFESVDGRTTAPGSYIGPIGFKLPGCENLPVVGYEPVSGALPEVDAASLSTDQEYLLDISRAIASGVCPDDLRRRNPGKIHKARWLTTANRVLRLYVSTNRPSTDFKLIVRFLLTVYVSMWFKIRRSDSISEGPRHLFETIERCRYLPQAQRLVVERSIQQNAYFALPENILLSMLTDACQNECHDALAKILRARQQTRSGPRQAGVVRHNIVPRIDFEARLYYEMIDWTKMAVTSPPVLNNVSDAELIERLSGEELFRGWAFCFPCHTVAVERSVKLVTE